MSQDYECEVVAAALRSAFADTTKKPKRITSNPRYHPEDEEIQDLLKEIEWSNLPKEFLLDTTAWILMTQDGLDYFLPGIVLAGVSAESEARDSARYLLSNICVERSLKEWLTTLRKYSREQIEVIHEAIKIIRTKDEQFWINTSFDEAYCVVTRLPGC